MAKCSYAQNREDILLARALSHSDGFYIDVGAGDPIEHSVTRYFSELGWSGINVEPQQQQYERLVYDRPRDVCIQAVVLDKPGHAVLTIPQDLPGFATSDMKVAEALRKGGIPTIDVEVTAVTLTAICEEYVDTEIDFLKIDVEGSEAKVLEGADFARWRPRVVVVEATEQNSSIPSHARWEHLLTRHDYIYASFDGLNRYYVRSEDQALVPVLSVPVNVLDDWYPYEYTSRLGHMSQFATRQRDALERISLRLDSLKDQLSQNRGEGI